MIYEEKYEESFLSNLFKLTKVSKPRNFLLLGIIILIYLLENFLPGTIKGSKSFIYIGKPVMWIGMILITWNLPRTRQQGKVRLQNLLMWITILVSGAYILLLIIVGFIEGFGKSPYDHSLWGIFINLLLICSSLIGREFARDYLINNRRIGKSRFLYLVLVAVLMTFTNLPISSYQSFKTKFDIIKFAGDMLLPELSNNIFAAYLVYMGGPILSIIYLGIQQGFYWLFPVLPNLSWISKALIGTLSPFFSFMILQYIYNMEVKEKEKGNYKKEPENPFTLIITSIISIAIVWFSAGVFPIRPYVIATGSMQPMIYPGDMVLVKKMETKDLAVGDVIQFKSNEVYIFHRIIDIMEDKEGIGYKTKGDNNSAADPELIRPGVIRGIVVYTIPKIGWPTLFLKSNGGIDEEQYEF